MNDVLVIEFYLKWLRCTQSYEFNKIFPIFQLINTARNKLILSHSSNVWLYVIIMSRTSFRVNLHSLVCLNVNELLAQSRHHIWSLSDSNGIGIHNHRVCKRTWSNHKTRPTRRTHRACKRTLNYLAKQHFGKWLSVRLRNKWLWVRILSLLRATVFELTST